MVEFGPDLPGLEASSASDEEFDLCLAQARLVVIGLEESARAASRHPSPCMVRRPVAVRNLKARPPWLLATMQILQIPGSLRRFLWVGDHQAAGAVWSKGICRTAIGTPPRSGPIPRSHSRSRS